MEKTIKQDEIVNFLKKYGFVFPCSEIYNGLANAWDYGPLGVLLKNNLKSLWWKYFITSKANMVGLDSAIFLNPNVWKASGHIESFSDPLIDCKHCKKRFRADKIINDQIKNVKINENSSLETLQKIINENHIKCPNCKHEDWTELRKFNLMFQTNQSIVKDKENTLYLRPETAQGIFINFNNIQRTTSLKLPFGVGQIGKAFRNEITPGNFIFRTREFEQMEIEFFCFPQQAEEFFNFFLNEINFFLLEKLRLNKEKIKTYEHPKSDLSHYAKRTIDFQYNFPHGWSELWGLTNRTDYDLLNHQKNSGKNLMYLDQKNGKKIIPYVIEPSVGVERLLYAIICDAFTCQKIKDDNYREILCLSYELCPYKVAVLPLSVSLIDAAKKIYQQILNANISATFAASGSIGKRYRKQDAIGTYYCLTIDFETVSDQCVTIRHRDTMQQKRIKINEINNFLSKKMINE